jgi:ketosteroid isomerase-like protein
LNCAQDRLSPGQIASEKEAIEDLLEKLFAAYGVGDKEGVLSAFSPSAELVVFGTDAREVFHSIDEFGQQLDRDFQVYGSMQIGEFENLSIRISTSGDLAVAVLEAPVTMDFEGAYYDFYMRTSRTLVKENGAWLIVQSISAIAMEGQSSEELMKQD